MRGNIVKIISNSSAVNSKNSFRRCFRGKSRPPVIYRNNNSAWMTSKIWTEYLNDLNKSMIKEKRKILMFVDNCPGHTYQKLSNINLMFLPQNTTSRLQPMDAGVIHSLKASYRQRFGKRLLAVFDEKKFFELKDIDLYESIIMLTNAWNELRPQIIQNCFRKTGFIKDFEVECLDSDLNPCVNSDISVNTNDWNEITDAMGSKQLDFEEYVTCDDNVMH